MASSRTQEQAVATVMSWIASNIDYRLDRSAPQDPESVLVRRTAYCTGIARLAVQLLGEIGINARETAGYTLTESGGSSVGFHRWIEVRYQDGWRFVDPKRSVGFVPATYVRLSAESVPAEGDPSTRWRLVSEKGRLTPVTAAIELAKPLSGVFQNQPVKGARLAISLTNSGLAKHGSTVVLLGAGWERKQKWTGRKLYFIDLAADRYTVSVRSANGAELGSRAIELGATDRFTLKIN